MRLIANETVGLDTADLDLFTDDEELELALLDTNIVIGDLILGRSFRTFVHGTADFGDDQDVYFADLEAGDSYRFEFTLDRPALFDGRFAIRGIEIDGGGSALFANDFTDGAAEGDRVVVTPGFTVDDTERFAFFTEVGFDNFSAANTTAARGYGVELVRIRDVNPWEVTFDRDGDGTVLVIDPGNFPLDVNERANFSVRLRADDISIREAVSISNDGGSLRVSQTGNEISISGSLRGNGLSPLDDLDDLLRVELDGLAAPGSISIRTANANVAGENVPFDTSAVAPARGALQGTNGADRLEGTAGADVILALNGADTVIGGAGDDTIEGGRNASDLRDVVFGGAGGDSIDGGAGNDSLRGDAGDDTIAGGLGADTVIGGQGDDVLTGSEFSDLVFGGDGMDFVNGGFGSDRVNGGNGADSFFHVGVRGHGSDFIQDYDAAEGDVLVYGGAGASANQFQVNFANTAGAGNAGTEEAFVIFRPTGQILWALIDGAAQDEITLRIGAQEFDLLA